MTNYDRITKLLRLKLDLIDHDFSFKQKFPVRNHAKMYGVSDEYTSMFDRNCVLAENLFSFLNENFEVNVEDKPDWQNEFAESIPLDSLLAADDSHIVWSTLKEVCAVHRCLFYHQKATGGKTLLTPPLEQIFFKFYSCDETGYLKPR